MERKYLEDLGLTKEQIDGIMAEHGKSINTQRALTTAEAEKLKTANATLEQLQTTVKKFDGVDLDQLKKDAQDWETKYNADTSKLKLEHKLETSLITNKAKNAKAVKALLDMDAIKMDGDKLLGLDDQLEKLKKDADYLFEIESTEQDPQPAAQQPTPMRINSGGTHGQQPDPKYDKMSDAEYYAATMKKQKE